MKTTAFIFVCILMLVDVIAGPITQEFAESGPPAVICKLQMKKGFCRALIPRWMYDPRRGNCIEFKYGGCGGNGNNFKSQSDCVATCSGLKL